MKSKKIVLGLSVAIAVALTGSVLTVTAAAAAYTDCSTTKFCAWDPNAFAGLPYLSTSYNVVGGTINVTDDITSSGWNRRSVGEKYCGRNVVGLGSVLVTAYPLNTGSDNYSSTNNTIDYFQYGTC